MSVLPHFVGCRTSLYSPVEELCDGEDFFGGACDLVDPAELLELFAGLTEDAEAGTRF
jgi:hypothetical protein